MPGQAGQSNPPYGDVEAQQQSAARPDQLNPSTVLLQRPPPKSGQLCGTGPTKTKPALDDVYGPAKSDPLFQRYIGVVIIICLTLWSFYVVVGRVCAPAIQGKSIQGYGKGVGVGTLVAFVLLWIMFSWSYIKMVTIGPGFARLIVAKSPPPPPSAPDLTYIPYHPPPPLSEQNAAQTTRLFNENSMPDPAGPDPSELAPVAHAFNALVHRTTSDQGSSSTRLAHPAKPTDKVKRTRTGKRVDEVERPVPRVDPGPRWCRYCEIHKPDRTHHCRHCGTCVMQFDHHCLWIGQCVGWANHKYFITFNFWGALFCLYIFIFLVITSSRSTRIDGQQVGLLVCAGFFSIFTVTMFPSHVYLILTGKTTVESYAGRDQTEMEHSILHSEFGFMWRDHDKRQVRRRWEAEFGGVNVDERWRAGSWRDLWVQQMGKQLLGWILPIGRPLGDGLHFPSHPAFGPNGEWLKRKDWPRELQQRS